MHGGVIGRVDVEMEVLEVVKELEVHQQISAVMNHSRHLAFSFTGTKVCSPSKAAQQIGAGHNSRGEDDNNQHENEGERE